MSPMVLTKQSNISNKDKEKKNSNKRKINLKNNGLSMPAAPVTSTLTGSFSMFRKLHIYLTSFQKKAIESNTTRPFWSNAEYSIFSKSNRSITVPGGFLQKIILSPDICIIHYHMIYYQWEQRILKGTCKTRHSNSKTNSTRDVQV